MIAGSDGNASGIMSRVIFFCALLSIAAAMPMYYTPEPTPMMDIYATPAPDYVLPVMEPSVPPTKIDLPVTPPPSFGVQNAVAETPLTEPLTVATVPTASPVPFLPPVVASANGTLNGTMNEGCVAVEHLEGYVLQHPVHLSRQVLCSVIGGTDFCATPNHAIIVDGYMTSMKQLCARPSTKQCVASVKLVNNLKITRNKRAVVSDRITVTPYDMRFPKIAVWSVQILEELFSVPTLTALLVTAATAGMVSMRKKSA